MNNLAEMATSFFESASKFAASGFKVTPIEILSKRLSECERCENLQPKGFGGTGQCGICGCSIKIKTRMATTECPIFKWRAVS